VIDIGGGDSRLVDCLLDRQLSCLSVLDISGAILARARRRLGPAQGRVRWIESDVTDEWPVPKVDIWHDRAVFHFLTSANERQHYRARIREALRPRGSAIIATFAMEGPEMCTGLATTRYSPETLEAELGPPFRLEEAVRETHLTPFGAGQAFWYCRLTRAD
jgi:hypothetical protein